MARNSQKIIQLLRSSQIYVPTGEGAEAKTGLQNAIASFNAAFVQAANPQDGEIMLARYQEEQGGPVKAVLAAYTNKSGESGFTFYVDTERINEIVEDLAEQVSEVETKNTLDAADESVVVDVQSEGTTIGVNVDWTNEAILKLGNDGIYTDVNLVKVLPSGEASEGVVIDANLDANIREAYRLMSENTQIGQQINIYKDSSLIEIYLGSEYDTINSATGEVTKYAWQSKNDPTSRITDAAYQSLDAASKENYEALELQSLNYKYVLADGTYQLVKIDVSKFLAENEFGAGLKVQNGVVSLDVRGTVTVGENVTYVAIKTNDETDKLTLEEYNELSEQQKENYYRYVNTNDPTDKITESAYNALSAAEQENYEAISENAKRGTQTNVFNESNGVVDVNAIQEAINFASLSAAAGVQVSGSDSIRVDTQNTVYVRLSEISDNALTIETGANKGVYLSNAWDCGEY